MTTLNIGGKRVKVSDDFLRLSPEQQNATVDEIARSLGGGAPAGVGTTQNPWERTDAEVKNDQAIIDQRQYDALPGWQKPLVAGSDILSSVSNGATFGFGDKAVAGARSMFTGKSYEDELVGARRKTQGARNRSGWAGTLGELAGGVRTAASLAGRGLTLTGMAGRAAPGLPRLSALSGAMAAEGGAYGAASALGNDTDLATGVATGAVIGGLTPGAFAVLRNTFAPIFARLRPEQATNSAIESMVARSGRTQQQIVDDLNAAAREGQDVFNVADALGNPGQRMLSTVARTPGDARGRVVDALEHRQAGQSNRISTALSDAFAAPDTAAQRTAALTASRRAAGNANYGAARQAAGAVNTAPAAQLLDDIVRPGVTPMVGTGAADSGVYATLNRMRSLLGRGNTRVSDYDRAFMAKQEMDAIIEQGGVAANLLRPARNALDDALAQSSAPYGAARDAYRQGSRNIEAVETGGAAASGRMRAADTIPAFQRMSQPEQEAFRAGYVDPLIAKTEAGAIGVNKARPLINDKMATEFPAFAANGGGPRLQRQLGREQTMFETRGHALGGSRTADNLADQAEMSLFDPSILGNLLSGNFMGAAASAGRQSIANIQGLSPTVRAQIADFLLTRNSTPAMQRIARAIAQGQRVTQRDIATIRLLVGSGVMGTSAAQRRGQ